MPEHTDQSKDVFVGGTTLTGAGPSSETEERTEPVVAASDVSPPTPAAQGPADATDITRQARSRQRDSSPAVSPLSIDKQDYLDKSDVGESRNKFESRLAPPTIPAAQRTSDSPVRDSKFMENL